MFDEDLEKAILYYMIFENAQFILDEEDFINPTNKNIIKAINELKAEKKEISILSIKSKMKEEPQKILQYLSCLSEYIYGSNQDDVYNKIIDLSKQRKLFDLLRKSVDEIKGTEDINLFSEKIIKSINKIQEVNMKEKSFVEKVADTVQDIEEKTLKETDYSLYTGMIDLDKLICGLHNEELTIIGARPGVGKTTFALQIAEHIASKGVPVAIISLEMSDSQVIQKMIARKSRINSYKMRMGTLENKDLEAIGQTSAEIATLPIYLTTNSRTIQQIEATARNLKNKNKLGL